MRYNEFSRILVEDASKSNLESILRKNGFTNFKYNGSKLQVLVQIPDGQRKEQFRTAVLQEILGIMEKELPDDGPQYSDDATLSSIGGIIFSTSPIKILVKDEGKQGDKSAGVANEIELAGILESLIEKYGKVNVTFVDPRGKKLKIKDCTRVDVAGRDTAGRKKADVVLKSEKGSLPISIKKLDADMWESADSLFGARARKILDKLVDNGEVELEKIKERKGIPVYKLSKEIVMEPTEEEAMNAIFGSDLNPKGGVVIQTFKPEHFTQEENNVTVDCHAVISSKDEIPESHLMVWILRNDSDRNSASMGIAGIRPLGVTLTRGIGRKGTKDVILVDVKGNVVENPNVAKNKDIERVEKEKKKPEPGSKEAIGRERR